MFLTHLIFQCKKKKKKILISYHVYVILKTPHKSVLIFNVNYNNLLPKRRMVLYEKKVADYVK